MSSGNAIGREKIVLLEGDMMRMCHIPLFICKVL